MKSIAIIFIGLFLLNQSEELTNDAIPYPDNSLYIEQYQELGIPSPNKVWNAAEYKRAVKVITGFYNVDKWSIPRKNSPYSGALFERMTQLENFKIISESSIPLQERLKEHDELLLSLGQLLNMYNEPQAVTQRFGIETLSFLVLSAQTTEYSISIVQELQKMMSGKGLKNSDLDLMHHKLISGISLTIEEHLLLIQTDYLQYQSKDMEWFTNEIIRWAMTVKSYLTEEQIHSLNKKLTILITEHPNSKIKNSFKKLQKNLKNEVRLSNK